MQPWRVVDQIAVVCKHPIAPPQLAHKRVTVFKINFTLRGFADMGNHVATFDGVVANQLRHRRCAGTLVIDKMAHRFALKKCNAPTVTVVVGDAAPLRKPAEAEGHIGGRIAVHAQQLAHGSVFPG